MEDVDEVEGVEDVDEEYEAYGAYEAEEGSGRYMARWGWSLDCAIAPDPPVGLPLMGVGYNVLFFKRRQRF